MSKVVFLLSLFGIAILFVFGMVAPDNPVMWMASTSSNFAFLRLAMIIVLVALLVTNPPRNIYLRRIVGVFSIFLASWALSSTYQNEMKILDSLSLLEVSISAGLAILERQVKEQTPRVGHYNWKPTLKPDWL